MDGFWTAEFGSSTGKFGGGVAIFEKGTIVGGDGTYFYMGEYTLQGSDFRAVIKVSPFIEGAESIFETTGKDLTLELTGSITSEGRAIAQGYPRDMPNLQFGVKFTKRR
jgi:hypothetical protein